MPLSTYSELKTSVKNWLAREDDGIDSYVEDFIAMAETEIVQTLQVLQMEETADLSIVSGVADLPSDFLGHRYVLYDGEPLHFDLPENLRREYHDKTGDPSHYSIEEMKLWLWPTQSATVTLKYHSNDKLPRLSDSQTSNWLLALYPNLYLRASLAIGFEFFGDPLSEPHAAWTANQISKLNSADRKRRVKGAGSFAK